MTVTFILNVEDTRRKAKNFSVNLTRGVNVVNEVEAENERRRDDIVEEEIPKKNPRISLSPPIFSLVVRDFEIEFGGYVTSPKVGLITQINVPVDDSDFYEDQFDFDISDNDNPRVNLNNTVPLKIRVGEESFASAVLSLDFNYNVETNLDLIPVELEIFDIGWQVGSNEGELNLHKITLTTDVDVEYSHNRYFETLPVTLTTSTLGVEFGGNIESLGLGLGPVDSGFDSEINLRLPNNMVTSPDFDA